MWFLKFILIVFIVLTVLGWIGRIFLRIYLARLARRMQQQYEAEKGQKVGETYIKDTSSKEKIVDKTVGDYVDFEEIKQVTQYYHKMIEIVAGIDIGGTNSVVGLVTRDGDCVAETTMPTRNNASFETFIESLSESMVGAQFK